jgi:hypothetical protein
MLRLSSNSWDSIIYEHQSIVQLIINHDSGDVEHAVDTHLTWHIVNASDLQHPEYFKQDIYAYACPVLQTSQRQGYAGRRDESGRIARFGREQLLIVYR